MSRDRISAQRPLWKRGLSFAISIAVILLCVWLGRTLHREYQAGQLAPQLEAATGKPTDAIGDLISLRCDSADEALAKYAAGSPRRCYFAKRRIFLWAGPRAEDGTQLLMYYRLAPGSEDALLGWNVRWQGKGIGYDSAELIRLGAADGKLTVEFRLSPSFAGTAGLAGGKSHTASFTPDEFVQLMDDGELKIKKASLRKAAYGWPVNLLERAGAFTDEVRGKLKKK